MQVNPRQTAIIVSNDSSFSNQTEILLKQQGGFERVSVSPTSDAAFSLDSVDCVILDRNDAGEIRSAIGRFRRNNPDCAIIICSRPEFVADIKGCFSNVNVEHVPKPFTSEELELRLNKIHCVKKQVAELEHSMQFIRQVSDLNPELIYLFDAKNSLTIYVNRKFCEVVGCTPLGIEPDGMVYLGSIMRTVERERLHHSLAVQMCNLEQNEFVTHEYEILDVHKEWRWIRTRETVFERDVDEMPSHVLGIAEDISDTRKLAETNSWLTAIVASSNDAIIGKSLDGTVLSWNSSAERLYGYQAKEICGRHISVLVPANERDEVSTIMKKIQNREPTERFQTRRLCKDGSIIDVAINVSPVIDWEGRLVGASTIAHRI